MKCNRIKTLILSFICSGILLLSACAAEESGDSEQGPKPAVELVTVQQESVSETIQAVGSLEADQFVRIRPEISGRLEKVAFKEGDTVEQEQLLFQIEADSIRARVRSRQSQLEEARSRLKNAKQTYERQKRLHEQGLTSSQSFDDALEELETARAQVQGLQAELDEVREELEDATIRAPFDGMVGERMIDQGNLVEPNERLTTFYKLDPIRVRFTVPERYAGRVRVGQRVKVEVRAFPGEQFTGEVFFVSPEVRDRTRDLQLKAHVNNMNLQLRPGMFADVELFMETRENRPTIPSESLISTREGHVVFRFEDGKVHRESVEIGLRQNRSVEIVDGLAPGEKIVRSGHMVLSDGMKIRVIE